MSLIVTGSIGIDSIESPTGTVENVLGGSAIYFAAAASFFVPVRLVGAVGDDFPGKYLASFRHFQVDLAGLEQRQGSKTFRWRGRYHADMNKRDTIDVQLNVLGEKLPPVPAAYRDSRFVFLANTHPAGQLELLAQFPKARLTVADTMDLWINNEKPILLKLLKKIDGLVLNDSEAQSLTGQSNLVAAATATLKLGPRFVVVKKGEHGCMLVQKAGQKVNITALPAWPTLKVIDPTGAGDGFAGGMMGYLAAKGKLDAATLKQALAAGTVTASFNIESFSIDRLKQIKRRDIDQRYSQYRRMLAI